MSADLIVMYHSVVPDDAPVADWLHVPASRFAQQLRWLCLFFQPCTPAEFMTPTHSLRPRLLVTFDDGYANNLTVALPILRQAGVPALFFLATGYLDASWFWWDRLRAGLAAIGRRTDASSFDLVKRLPPQEVETAVTEHLRQAGAPSEPPPSPWLRPLRWEEAERLARSQGVFIGIHGDRHEIFSHLDREELGATLQRAQRQLAARLGLTSPWLAPPNGAWLSEHLPLFAQLGFSHVFTTTPGWVKRADSHDRPQLLPRLGIGADDRPVRVLSRAIKTRFLRNAWS